MSDAQTQSEAPPAASTQPPRMTSREAAAIVVSVLVTLASAGMSFLILFQAVPETSKDTAFMLAGTWMSLQTVVVAYWMGSSSGSAMKDRKQEPPR